MNTPRRIAHSSAVIAFFILSLLLPPSVHPVSAQTQPNIVVIITDDQNVDSLPVMRKLMSYPEGKWTKFNNAFANNSVCCPARATLLTGQYSHNHRVIDNTTGLQLDDTNTLPIWLDNAGYRTGLIGKYLNGFPWDLGTDYVPPGWDYFRPHGIDTPASVDDRTAIAADFINTSTEPFFLFLAFVEPHNPASVRERYRYSSVYVPPNTPNYNEGDVSDKPGWVRALPRLTDYQKYLVRMERLASQRSLLGVDDAVETIVNTLKNKGILENTMIIFIGDNGYSWGSHRFVGKPCVYEECSKIPLLIRYPGASENREENRLVTNVSIVPTIAEYAGITPGLPQDADSMIPLLNNTATSWYEAILLESGSSGAWRRFYAIRVPGWKYVEYENGDKELYHLELGVPDSDPHELYNRAKNPLYKPAIDFLKPVLESMKGSGLALTATPDETPDEELLFPLQSGQLYFPMLRR